MRWAEFKVVEGKITELRIGFQRGHADDPFPDWYEKSRSSSAS